MLTSTAGESGCLLKNSSTLFDSENVLEMDIVQLWLRFCLVAFISAFAFQLRIFGGLHITLGMKILRVKNKGHG